MWSKFDPYDGREGAAVDPLRVLAIDTALEACSAAILDTERGDGVTSRSLPMARGHAEALVPLIAAIMSDANVEFTELDRIAVTVGPGSFTGLRVGVAAARGIALATRSEEHTSELQSQSNLVCRLLL